MHDSKAMSFAMLVADAFGCPTTDGVDDVDRAVEGIKANWVAMKEYGAVNTRCTVTGGNILRAMTLWKSQETLDDTVDKIRTVATRS